VFIGFCYTMGEAAVASSASAGSVSSGEGTSVEEKLSQYLGPEFVSKRAGPGRTQLAYVQGHHLISIANAIFGFDGWSTALRGRVIDFIEKGSDGTWSVGINVVMRVSLAERHGSAFREDLGYGLGERMRDKASALQKAGKEAATDAIKRALRQFGEALGNCLYNKEYLQRVARVKSGFDVIDFDEDQLYRLKVNECRKRGRIDGDGLEDDTVKKQRMDSSLVNGVKGVRFDVSMRSSEDDDGDAELLEIAFEDDEWLNSMK